MLRITAVLAALISVALGLFFVAWSSVVFGKLSAEYQDGATATYVIIGLLLLGIALSFFASAAVLVWAAAVRTRSHRRVG